MRMICTILVGLLSLTACGTTQERPAPMAERPRAPATMHVSMVPARTGQTPSLWNQEPQSLFGNRRARNVGDILTVIVSVDESAQLQNSLSRSRSNQEDFNVSALFGAPEYADGTLPEGASLQPAVGVTRSNAASGDGLISRQERITLRLAAEVVEKLPNGHLVVVGTQRIRVNNETRDLRLQGIVRPDDITRDNTITHDKVAAADILYTGHGQIAQTTKPRWGSRFLDLLIPF